MGAAATEALLRSPASQTGLQGLRDQQNHPISHANGGRVMDAPFDHHGMLPPEEWIEEPAGSASPWTFRLLSPAEGCSTDAGSPLRHQGPDRQRRPCRDVRPAVSRQELLCTLFGLCRCPRAQRVRPAA